VERFMPVGPSSPHPLDKASYNRRRDRREVFMRSWIVWFFAAAVGAAAVAMAVAPPDEIFSIRLPSMTVSHRPGSGVVAEADGWVLSTGPSWAVKRIGERRWHVRRTAWKDAFWSIDTEKGALLSVQGGTFGTAGGDGTPLAAEVTAGPEGGFVVRFAAALEPTVTWLTGGIRVAVAGSVLASGSSWQTRGVSPFVFQLQHRAWEERFWQVDLGHLRVLAVPRGVFGSAAGGGTLLPYEVTSPRIASVDKVQVLRTPLPEVERLTVHLPSLDVAVDPASGEARVSVKGTVLDTRAWQVQEVAATAIRFRRPGWVDTSWHLQPADRQAFVGDGTERPLPARVTRTSEGAWRFSFGSDADPRLLFTTATATLEVVVAGQRVGDGSNWTARSVKPHLFHLKHASWHRFFWTVNALSKRAARVSGAPFGVSPERIYGGGAGVAEDPLPFRVTWE
jgi:hypothetical protein